MADLLLERAGEVAAIERAVRLARAGRARQLVVIGPAGSGRTSVLAHARRCAADHELTILHAEGLEHERDFPFALAGRLLGLEVQPEPGYDTLLELNRRLAARAPALIAVDDLDRCDAQSRDWLVFAARRLDRVGVAMVLVGDPGGLERAVELSLRPFSERAVATALHLQLGHTVDPAFARACHAATLGHPLLVCELAAAARDGQERADVVPSGVVRFLQRVLSPLPRNVRTLAHAVALLDQGASVHGAATLAGLGPDEAASAADRLRAAGLLVGDDAPAIVPPLLARAMYEGIPPALRGLWHARAARVAASSAGAVHHLLRSGPSGDPWVVETLAGAARRALADGRPDAAAELLCRAVREGAGDRGALLVALAEAQRRLIDRAEIEQLEAALAEGAPHRSTTSALARALLVHGRTADALALDGADPVELHAGARLLPGHGRAVAARLAIVCGREAEQQRALLACRAAEAACAADSVQAAVALASRALADDALDPESPAYFSACAALAWSDRLTPARVHLERALAHARRLGSVCGLVRAEAGLATVALRAGALDAAVVHATTALGAGRDTALVFPARAVLALALLEQDRLDDAESLCDATTPELRYMRGRLRLARHDVPGARADLLAVGEELTRDAIVGPAVIPWRSAAALAGAQHALALADAEYVLAVRFGAPRAIGRALRVLATVGPAAERTRHCREAVEVLAPSEARLEYAHALCDLGASLRRERARRAARDPLREALDLAARCGAVALVHRVREELAASGARPRRLAQSGRDALTPAELRVAHLAARGVANREIARTLVVTVKTVETELSHAYAKLGIRSRRELAGVLQTG